MKNCILNMTISILLIVLFCFISNYTNWYSISLASVVFGMMLNEIDNYFRD